MWQSRHVGDMLETRYPGLSVSLLPITTEGDRVLDKSLTTVGGKGLFIKELEVALLDNRADVAVHSMKDVPAELAPGLRISAILARGDPRDVLVSGSRQSLDELQSWARIGTSSLRRKSQLLARRADLYVHNLRGNVPTRLAKLNDGGLDAIVLAAAGLLRLELMDEHCCYLPMEQMLPAVGQGAIGIECRAADEDMIDMVRRLHDERTSVCVDAERAMSKILGGSCQIPIAGYARIDADGLALSGLVASPDGAQLIKEAASGHASDADSIGEEVASALLRAGADRILHQIAG